MANLTSINLTLSQSLTSKPEDIFSKLPFKKITICEGIINYKIIREIY